MAFQLFGRNGERKYLNESERARFLKAASTFSDDIRTLCELLFWMGCRISEALALTGNRVDVAEKMVIIESLKKRRLRVYRGIPVPEAFLKLLANVHKLALKHGRHLWRYKRVTAWRHIKLVMKKAGIVQGARATPRGLRHGFGVAAIAAGVPLNILQRWLGHAQIGTTSIYADVMGKEERRLAARMWA